ncbi:6063_t:CDS:1, partial [Diversispora eburnea]
MEEDNPNTIFYLKIKAFIPLDEKIKPYIDEQVIFITGKFVTCEGWYS